MAGGWSKQSGGDRIFFKFDTPGKELIGKWRGTRPGKYGDNGLIVNDEGLHEFPINAGLSDLVDMDKDISVKVVYIGKESLKNGNTFKKFEVFTWDTTKNRDDPVSEHQAPTEEPFQATDSDVPF